MYRRQTASQHVCHFIEMVLYRLLHLWECERPIDRHPQLRATMHLPNSKHSTNQRLSHLVSSHFPVPLKAARLIPTRGHVVIYRAFPSLHLANSLAPSLRSCRYRGPRHFNICRVPASRRERVLIGSFYRTTTTSITTTTTTTHTRLRLFQGKMKSFAISSLVALAAAAADPQITLRAELAPRQDDPAFLGFVSASGCT